MPVSPADIVAQRLVTGGLGVNPSASNPAWTVRVGREGDKPDRHITTYDTGGNANNPKWRINYPSVQVRVRGSVDRYDEGYQKMNDIVEYLMGIEPFDYDLGHVSGIIMIGGATYIGADDASRPLFTVNFRVFLEPAAGSSSHMHRESL